MRDGNIVAWWCWIVATSISKLCAQQLTSAWVERNPFRSDLIEAIPAGARRAGSYWIRNKRLVPTYHRTQFFPVPYLLLSRTWYAESENRKHTI